MHLKFRDLQLSRECISKPRNGLANVDETPVDLQVKQKKVKERECWQEPQETECKVQNGCNQRYIFPFVCLQNLSQSTQTFFITGNN